MTTRDLNAEMLNQKLWDEIAPVHGEAYDTQILIDGGHCLDEVQTRALGDIQGKKILHLQCHIGTDTLSLVRLGAQVTGVDISGQSLKVARALSEQAGLPARFIQTPLLDLPSVLNETFDIVYTSIGVLCWNSDIQQWGQLIGRFLKPGGMFYIMESHPFLGVFDDETDGLAVRHSYLGHTAIDWPGNWPDYADESYMVQSSSREYLWSLSDIISSLLKGGLTLSAFKEYDFLHWKALPNMVLCDDGFWRLPKGQDQIPLLFSLKAHKNK